MVVCVECSNVHETYVVKEIEGSEDGRLCVDFEDHIEDDG